MKKLLVIIGASGHGKVVADIAFKMKKWENITFLDDDADKKTVLGFEVIGRTADAIKYREVADFIVAIGNNELREKIQEHLVSDGSSLVSLIHTNAVIGIDVEIGIGSVVMAGVVINSSSRVGKGCIINTSSSLDHDCLIQDYVHISPGARIAGNVRVGKATWIGIGCNVNNNISICRNCKIGAGSVVIQDIDKPGTFVGVPVRRVDK